jgi:hypothetical protein
MEVSATMPDLDTRLAEAADRAALLARAPGPKAARRRARARRRRRAASAVLALVVVAGLVAIGRGAGLGLPTVDPLGQDRWQHLPWRGLEAAEWQATVPDEVPQDPVVVAARGEQAGAPWRLVVYPSTYRPGGNGAPVDDVCYILDWFLLDGPTPPSWQANGTCAPEAQATTVMAAGGPGAGRQATAVIGRAPASAARVRLELRGRAPVETATVAARGLPGRFYAAFLARASYLERAVALDHGGRPVGQAPGPGDLSRDRIGGFPPTGPVAVVGRTTTRAGEAVELVVWPAREGYCLALDQGQGGGSSGCATARSAPGVASVDILAPQLHCSSSWSAGAGSIRLRLALGGVPRSARTVRVEAAGTRVEVPARDGGERLGRAFFLAELPARRPLGPVRVTALDGKGTAIGSWALGRCG